jgi:hypothetical protein
MPLMYTKYFLFTVLATTIASSFIPALNVSAQAQGTNQTMAEDVITRDSVTLLLESKSVSAGAHIHLYDTGSFHIMDGHVSVNIPCNANSEPLLQVLGGIAGDKTFLRPLELHPVANMSITGVTCMYHTDLASEMGPNGWLITDLALHNPSNKEITFPQDSVAIVGINEIMKDPAQAPASQGGMTIEERGGGVSQMTNMAAMNQTSSATTTPSS